MPAPRFSRNERPADIMDTAGRWLAAELGWRWVTSRHTAEILDGTLTLRLILQSSTWSRAGVATWVRHRISVLDSDLRAWRLARPHETVFPGSKLPPFAFNTMLGSVEAELGNMECSGLPLEAPAPRAISLDGFTTGFRQKVLPMLDLFRSSSMLANSLPDSWLTAADSGLIEQALSRDDSESAALLMHRYMERPLPGDQSWSERIDGFTRGWEDALSPGQPPQHGVSAFGWLARIHGLPGPLAFRGPHSDQQAT
jgi:hypothetical protein